MTDTPALPELIQNPEARAACLALEQAMKSALQGTDWKLSAIALAWQISRGDEHFCTALVTGDTSAETLDYMADAIAGREEFAGQGEDITALFRRN